MTYLLVGNYGSGNLGDEALKDYFLNRFPGIDWKVVSARPGEGEYNRFPFGIRSIVKNWPRTLSALRKSEGIIFGGGSLFTDIESRIACLLWWWHGFISIILGKKIILAFQGIGPFRTRVGEWCARWIVKHSAFISVRDRCSAERIESWQKNTKIIRSFDPVISLIQTDKVNCCTKDMLAIIPRSNSGDDFIKRARSIVSSFPWKSVRILSFQPEREIDICRRIQTATGGDIIHTRTLDDLTRGISCASKVLTHRYHGALAAVALGRPFEAVNQYDGDKLAGINKIDEIGGSAEALLNLVIEGEKRLRDYLENN